MLCCFFFFKQKTAYEMRISDWSSDVCSSDLIRTLVKKVENAVAAGDQDGAAAALKAAQPERARGVAKGVLPNNTVARKYSRLTTSVNAIARSASSRQGTIRTSSHLATPSSFATAIEKPRCP